MARRVSKEKLEFLEYLIWRSKNASEFTKKCLIWLIRQSEGLTKEVGVAFKDDKISREVSLGFHDMCSCNGTTHVVQLFRLAGSLFVVGNKSLRKSYMTPFAGEILWPTSEDINQVVPADPYKT
jgi:hypothetical protein